MTKLLTGTYKTFQGAAKRCAFERSMNPSEFARGDAAHRYMFAVTTVDGLYRVTREIAQ